MDSAKKAADAEKKAPAAGDEAAVGGEMMVIKLPQVMMGHIFSVFNGIPTEVEFSSLLFCCCWF